MNTGDPPEKLRGCHGFRQNFTTMKFDDLLGDGKTKACTTVSGGSGRVQTEELLEDPFQFFRRMVEPSFSTIKVRIPIST